MHEPSEMADGQEAREDAMVGLACCCSRVDCATTAKWPWPWTVEAGGTRRRGDGAAVQDVKVVLIGDI